MKPQEAYTILIIDDSESDRLTYGCHLQAAENCVYEVLEAESLETGLNLWQQQSPDLVLLDINLPDDQGLELIKCIKKDYPNCKLPIISLTGLEAQRITIEAMKLGVQDCLLKEDITATALCRSVKNALNELTLSRQLMRSQQEELAEHQRVEQELKQLNQLLETRIAEQIQELRESQQFVRTLLDTLPAYVFWKNQESVFMGCNQMLADLMGLSSPDEFVNTTGSGFGYTSEELQQYKADDMAVMKSGQPKLRIEETMTLPNGETIWIETHKSPLRDRTGTVVGIVGVFQDITMRKSIEESLKVQIAAIESARDGIVIFKDGKRIYVNQAIVRLFGYDSSAEMLGQSWEQLYSPEESARLKKEVSNLERDRYWQGEAIALRKDGTAFHEELSVTLTDDGLWIVVCRDISDRKANEEALQLSEEFFRNAFENTPVGMSLVSPDGRILRSNTSICNLFGYDESELIGRNFQEITYPDDLDHDLTFVSQLLAGEIDTYDMEKRYISKQGQIVWGLVNVSLVRDGQSQPMYFIAQIQDITARKQAEENLKTERLRLQLALDAAKMGTWSRSSQSHQLIWSDRFQEIVGFPPEAFSGNPETFLAILHPEDRDRVVQAIAHTFATGDPYHMEYRIFRSDGEMRWVSLWGIHTEMLSTDERQLIGVIADISDRKKAELLLISEKERAEKSELKLQKTQINLERANQKLLQLIDTDILTKIANRRCFNIRFRQEWQRLYREQEPLSLIIFDVDYFKYYNDRYGHLQGDHCLIQVAQTANKAVGRSTDLVARVGGEEFAVILPNTDIEGAKITAENIRLAIESLAIPHQDSLVNDKVTISLGIMSVIPTHGQSSKNLINQADQALFEAKKRGRNQFVIFSEDEFENKD